jgi:hypothetical protein
VAAVALAALPGVVETFRHEKHALCPLSRLFGKRSENDIFVDVALTVTGSLHRARNTIIDPIKGWPSACFV